MNNNQTSNQTIHCNQTTNCSANMTEPKGFNESNSTDIKTSNGTENVSPPTEETSLLAPLAQARISFA